jgi:DNA-directed RNA polymerase III subunit RPC4
VREIFLHQKFILLNNAASSGEAKTVWRTIFYWFFCIWTYLKEASPLDASSASGSGRGRGRGEGKGGPVRPQLEMTASGPFAMGPASAGLTPKRAIPRSNFSQPSGLGGGAGPSTPLSAGLSGSVAPSLKAEQPVGASGVQIHENDEDVYSDPEDGVEIVDMEHVRQMDWMAPDSIKRTKNIDKRKKLLKKESKDIKGKGKGMFCLIVSLLHF